MKYCIEITRDGNGDVVSRNLLYAVTSTSPAPRDKECVFIDGPDVVNNMAQKKVSVDQDGNLFLEDDSAKVDIKNSEDAIAMRIARQDFGRRLIAIISIRNDAKSFTQQQTVQFMADYSAINSALLNGAIGTAKTQIEAITPDGTITTQGDKDALLTEITANEDRLGY